MPKRAAFIITDFDRIVWDAADLHPRGPWETDASEQLLADLRALVYPGPGMPQAISDAAARVRALLPQEDHE